MKWLLAIQEMNKCIDTVTHYFYGEKVNDIYIFYIKPGCAKSLEPEYLKTVNFTVIEYKDDKLIMIKDSYSEFLDFYLDEVKYHLDELIKKCNII